MWHNSQLADPPIFRGPTRTVDRNPRGAASATRSLTDRSVKQPLGLLLLVAVGCATQPNGRLSSPPNPSLQPPLPPKVSLSPRVGVEFLSTGVEPSLIVSSRVNSPEWPGEILAHGEDRTHRDWGPSAPNSRVQVEPARSVSPPGATDSTFKTTEHPSELPWLSTEALTKIEDPTERFTLHFLNRMIGEDRRRVQREFGAPILFNRWRDWTPSQGLDTHLDAIDREDQALLLSRVSGHLVRRPLRAALRKGTLIADLTNMIDVVKESIPLTGAYDQQTRSRLGRLSMKLRPRDDINPFEITYRQEGWRVGSGPGRLKFGFEADLTDQVYLGWHSHYFYASDEIDLSASLHYRVNHDTNFNVLVSDSIDIVTGGSLDPVIRSPVSLDAVDDSSGVLFYVEHLF